MRRFLTVVFTISLFWTLSVKGSHMAGGEMTYDYLGEGMYRIHLSLYLDCYSGIEGENIKDRRAYYAVFDALSKELLFKSTMTVQSAVRVDRMHNRCDVSFDEFCMFKYSFDTLIKLSENENGYIVAYQRCCRNRNISNAESHNTGATYFVTIPSVRKYGSNSAPVFNRVPANVVCINQPVMLDHSVTDLDGDSIVYSLCRPFSGADLEISKPDQPSHPPYSPVLYTWQYETHLPFLSSNGVHMDRKTGQLQFRPSKVGRYVYAVCAMEYRNGEMMSKVFRDYQVNVIKCGRDDIPRLKLPDIICDRELQVSVEVRDSTEVFWDFGVDGIYDDTSNLHSDRFIYPKDGVYQLKLKVIRKECADSLFHTLRVKQPGLQYFENASKCKDERLTLQRNNLPGNIGVWESADSFSFINDSTIEVIAQTAGYYLYKTKLDSCTWHDSVYVNILSAEPGILVDSVVSCKSVIYHFELYDSAAIGKAIWSVGRREVLEATSFEYTMPKQVFDTVFIELHDTSNCRWNSYYLVGLKMNIQDVPSVPNVISPNNDGLNDCFKVPQEYIECGYHRMSVYNRWGERVYQHHAIDQPPCWDGTNYKNGKLVPASTYFYILEVDGFERYGTVTVVR